MRRQDDLCEIRAYGKVKVDYNAVIKDRIFPPPSDKIGGDGFIRFVADIVSGLTGKIYGFGL